MMLDVVYVGDLYLSIILIPVAIILIFITIGRYNAYKKNSNNKTKIQFNVFLIITLVLNIYILFTIFYRPPRKPYETEWHNISNYRGD